MYVCGIRVLFCCSFLTKGFDKKIKVPKFLCIWFCVGIHQIDVPKVYVKLRLNIMTFLSIALSLRYYFFLYEISMKKGDTTLFIFLCGNGANCNTARFKRSFVGYEILFIYYKRLMIYNGCLIGYPTAHQSFNVPKPKVFLQEQWKMFSTDFSWFWKHLSRSLRAEYFQSSLVYFAYTVLVLTDLSDLSSSTTRSCCYFWLFIHPSIHASFCVLL